MLLGILLGLLLGAAAQGQEPPQESVLTEMTMGTFGRTAFKVPESYGVLVQVAVSSDIHYLYFEDAAGTIRIVPIGQRGAVQRSRAPIQLLASEVFVIERGGKSIPVVAEPPAR
ncbi:MAG: hypothetical protein A3C53_08960 [Omnitrophica WOR_2 bacterium RIFCSPHIGHO2_02_FULL_68_15]|nr:MAG: hypothetical protein A3C53_08960 [Omnitrophica WOR_2 bacterium RIFCSPHIGHO2_02_FULL_68_15]